MTPSIGRPRKFFPGKFPQLLVGEVHLWTGRPDEINAGEVGCLSPDETARAKRFHFETDRRRYIASRGFLRRILAEYLEIAPDEVRFVCTEFGKPSIADSLLRFNLSHSEDVMLLAVAHGREVGVDVEAVRENVPFEMLAEHYFSFEDQWALRIAAESVRVGRFFELWTRTEALLKARGIGLSGDAGDRSAAEQFTVRNLQTVPGYAAALAVEGREFELSCWECPS